MRGPDVIETAEDARRGVSCAGLARLVLNDFFGFKFPAHLRFMELYLDGEYFEPVSDIAQAEAGDLVWFGRAAPRITLEEFQPVYDSTGHLTNWREYPVTHVGTHLGENETGVQIYHGTHVEGGDAVWPIDKFAEYSRYRKLYGITRLKPEYRQKE